jgi:hypothetical protein
LSTRSPAVIKAMPRTWMARCTFPPSMSALLTMLT